MYCKNCDMQNADGSVVCRFCGARLQDTKTENAAAAQGNAGNAAMSAKETGGKGISKLFGMLGRK